jgi:hypothetical protein
MEPSWIRALPTHAMRKAWKETRSYRPVFFQVKRESEYFSLDQKELW